MRRNLERLLRELYSAPRNREIDARKEKFEQLNQTIRASHGFVTSIPGDVEVRFDALPGSTLPDELCNAGYDVRDPRRWRADFGHGHHRAMYLERRWRVRAADTRIDKAYSVDRDARRHRQGEAVRFRHALS
jgi:hypothetical protein